MGLAELDTLQYKINRWARETFGDRAMTEEALPGCLAHLRREVDELCAAPDDPAEAADVAILVMRVCGIHGHSLIEAILAKFDELKLREWAAPDADGVRQHVKACTTPPASGRG